MDTSKTVTHISLCSGYGGIDIALGRVVPNLRTIAFSEIEAFACANLVAKMEAGFLDAAPIWTNLKDFPWTEFRGKVGIISGGFPCQPFSSAGKRVGDEDPRHLFPHILRGITECQPGLVFLENVEGIISAKLKGEGWRDPAGTPVLLHVLRELERVGYRATAGVFSSAEIGASHQRKRVYILARKMAHAGHNGFNGAEISGSIGSGENQGWMLQSQGMGSSQWNICLRPKPPGPNQWWWEPSRVLNAFTRIANRHGQFDRSRIVDDAGSVESYGVSSEQREENPKTGESGESVADSRCGECNGRQNGARPERTAQGKFGEAGNLRDFNVGDTSQRNECGQQRRGLGAGQETDEGRETNYDIADGSSETGSKDVADNQSNGWGSFGTESAGQLGQSIIDDGGESTMGHAASQRSRGGRKNFTREQSEMSRKGSCENGAKWEAQSSLGGNPYGSPDWLDYAELSTTVDSRTDELRLLGNGVDPDVAAKAFVTLYNRLHK